VRFARNDSVLAVASVALIQPLEADLCNEDSGKYIRKYLHSKANVDVEKRMRVYNYP
jgi:aromatic ring hydroxylase